MQLPEGAQYYRVAGTTAGTTVIKAEKTALYNIVIGQTKTGTVTFYDNASGTASGYLMDVINSAAAGGLPVSLVINARLRKGLTVVVGGTTDMLVMYQ